MMSEPSAEKSVQKKDWALTERAFQRLLDWLSGGASSDGQKYLEMRRRLAAYFDRKGCLTPDELADETLNRVARRLEEEDVTADDAPARYCYIVARFVFMEYLRGAEKKSALLDDVRRRSNGGGLAASDDDDEQEVREQLLNCLEQCTGRLEPPSGEIIIRYYAGKERVKIENRRALAGELGISTNALSIRACRIREKLEVCVRQCVGAR